MGDRLQPKSAPVASVWDAAVWGCREAQATLAVMADVGAVGAVFLATILYGMQSMLPPRLDIDPHAVARMPFR